MPGVEKKGYKPQRPKPPHRREAVLRGASAVLSDDAVLRIIDEWLVPRLVNDFIRSPKFPCNSEGQSPHNGDHS